MLTGRYDHTLDDKGRVSIPGRLREFLQQHNQDRLFVTNFISDGYRFLEIYLPDDWQRLEGRIRQMGRSFDRNMQLFQTYYIGGAHEVEVDRQGRVLIPPRLREYAGLKHEVTFSGVVGRVQLWDKKVLERVLGEAEREFEKASTNRKFWSDLGL